MTTSIENKQISNLENEIYNLFKKDNIQRDGELLSEISTDMTIQLSSVLKRLSHVSTNESDILEILGKCRLCELQNDNTVVKVKFERTTVILREVNEAVTEEQIRALFKAETLVSVEKEVANSWFVTFDTEEHARTAALEAMKKEIDGNKLHARLRTETLAPANQSNTYTAALMPPAPIDNAPDYNYYDRYFYPYDMNIQPDSVDATSFLPENLRKNVAPPPNTNYRNNNRNKPRKDDKRGRSGMGSHKGGGRRGHNSNRNSYRDDWRQQSPPSKPESTEGPNFPPLAVDDVVTGYVVPFISYTEDEIVNIVKHLTKLSLPKNIEIGDHSASIENEPNPRLLQNQRSMSIDQALQHGRPFRFASVDSSDYAAMIFGDPDDPTTSKAIPPAPAAAPTLKPLPASSSGIIPPSFQPKAQLTEQKAYASVVKNGRPETNSRPPPPAAGSNKPRPHSEKPRRKSRDKRDKNNGGDLTWEFHPSPDKGNKNKKPVQHNTPAPQSNSWAAIVTKPKNETPESTTNKGESN